MVVSGKEREVELHANLLVKVKKHEVFKVGDKIRVSVSLKRFKKNQRNHGGWIKPMEDLVDKHGSVIGVIEDEDTGRFDDVRVVFPCSLPGIFSLNAGSLQRHADQFEKGDRVCCVLTYESLKPQIHKDHPMHATLKHLKKKFICAIALQLVTRN